MTMWYEYYQNLPSTSNFNQLNAVLPSGTGAGTSIAAGTIYYTTGGSDAFTCSCIAGVVGAPTILGEISGWIGDYRGNGIGIDGAGRTIVCGHGTDSGGNTQALVWVNGIAYQLPTLGENPDGSTFGVVLGVSPNGRYICGYCSSAADVNPHAVVWASTDWTTGSLTTSDIFGNAMTYAVTNSGLCAGQDLTTQQAFVGDVSGGGITLLGLLPGGSFTVPTGINYSLVTDNVTIVGYGDVSLGVEHPFMWTAYGGLTDMGLPTSPTVLTAYAASITQTSSTATVLVGSQDGVNDYGPNFLWQDGTYTVITDSTGTPIVNASMNAITDSADMMVGMQELNSSTPGVFITTYSLAGEFYVDYAFFTPLQIGNVVSLTIGTPPNYGTVTISGKTILYTPTAGYAGADTFSYLVTDTNGAVGTATVNTINTNVS